MTITPSIKLTRAMGIRMIADACIVAIALAVALGLRLIMDMVGLDDRAFGDLARQYVRGFMWNAPWLAGLFVLMGYLNGFYTYGRAYQGRYKTLIIAHATTQTYLVFVVLTYFFWNMINIPHLPRQGVVIAWAANMVFTLISRTWPLLWERVLQPEREARRRESRPVESVLVIGGAGYIGSALLPKLLEYGYRVRVLDRFLYGTEPIRDIADHPNLELMDGDFRQVDKVVQAMQKMDAVIHLGAIVGDPACALDEDVTIHVNLSATQMIAQVAKACHVSRFIFASTCSVYGACDEVLDERSEVRPISLYGHTKLAAERGLMSMADEDFQPTIVRFATIYGLSGRTRFDLVVNVLAAKAIMDKKITVFGGAQWRPFVHVDDAALAVFTVLNAPFGKVANEVFNVGSDEQNYTIEDVGHLIHDKVPSAELLIDSNSPDQRNYRVSFAKIHRELKFEPRWTVESGIDQVINAVDNGHVDDYQDARYSNVKYLKDKGIIKVIRWEDDWISKMDRVDPAHDAPAPAKVAVEAPSSAN